MQSITHPKNIRGFTLVEIAIVMVIIGFALGMFLPMSLGMMKSQKGKIAQTKLDTIDTALVNFVAQNRRLPCPANGTIASGQVNAGVETINAATGLCVPANQRNGVVPWVTLGLAEDDAADPWFGRIMYRADPSLARAAPANPNALMNMSICDPVGTGTGTVVAGVVTCQVVTTPCTTNPGTCTSPANFLANKGLDVWNGVGGAAGWALRTNNRGAGTGAAYVLISQGPTGTGAYNSAGVLQPGTAAAGTDEVPNRNNRVIAIPSALANTYREAQVSDVIAAQHFDDYVSHPTILSVLQRANLGPRAN